MQLKRLEAYGFKSFADKTDIEFDKGITEIVGPNGSGKSNITDAIRWVLGEQNIRNLRGVKAEDVIFAGSATRHPLGVAEVSLVFQNDGDLPVDFQEVVVTRRLYRSGESEFYINRARCRLKDITTLFADTGLGQDGMSVIRQNRVDEILNSKPEERRLFFEETAGITKYRNRKKESMRKLADTEQNLIRVHDILQEIKAQLEPMAESAEKTKKYNVLQEEYQQCKLTELYFRQQALLETEEKQNTEIAASRDKVAEAEAKVGKAEAEKETLQKEVLDFEKRLTELAGKTNELRNSISAGKEKIARLEERSHQGAAEEQRIAVQKEEFSREIVNLDKKIAELAASRASEEALNRQAEEKLTSLHGQEKAFLQKLKEYDELLQQEKNRQDAVSEKIAGKKQERDKLATEIAVHEHGDLTAKADIEERENKISQQEKQLADTGAVIGRLQEETAQKEKQQQELAASLAELKEKQHSCQQERNLLQQKREAAETKVKFLQNMQKSYEGFGRGPKAILQHKDRWHGGICGAVAELIHAEEKYAVAIEIALGGNAQNIITKDEKTAKDAIRFLREEHLGRVTFLPLATITVRQPEMQDIRSEQGFLGYANELVNTAPEYRKAADFLLARTVVVDNLDNALALARKKQQRLRIVTLTGELLTPGGALTGGSHRNKEVNFFGRANELLHLQKEMKAYEDAWRQKKELLPELDAKTAKTQQAHDELAAKLQQLALQLAALRAEMKKAEDIQHAEKAELAKIKENIKTSAKTFAQLQNEQTRIAGEIRKLEAELAGIQSDIAELQSDYDDLRQDYEAVQKLLHQEELQAAVKRQALQNFVSQQEHFAQEKKRLADTIAGSDEQVENIRRQRVQDSEELENLQEKQSKWLEQSSLWQREYDGLYAKKMDKMAAGQQSEQLAREASAQLYRLQEKLHEKEVQLARVTVSRQQCEEQLMQEFGVSPETAAAKALDLPADEIKQKVQHLKRSIAAMGTINPNAIAEYEALQQRHDFLDKQADDLIAAKDDLQKIVTEIDAAMTKQFKSAFGKIKEYFAETFQQLFGGGKAQLLLTDNNDVLQAGVEIVVQLPEKKQQNLAALSGGERALTVIALLLSFLRYKPSPFTVLDEIDAPLDEPNIARFCKYVRKFAEKTQFIIVTHRKRTMEVADVMYGVTVEDSGVSKVISVRMEENAD